LNPEGEQWNLMVTNYPRTEVIKSNPVIEVYQNIIAKYKNLGGDYSLVIAQELSDDLAKLIVAAFDRTFADKTNDFCQFSEEEGEKLGLTNNKLEISMLTTLFNKCCGIGMARNPRQRPGLAGRTSSQSNSPVPSSPMPSTKKNVNKNSKFKKDYETDAQPSSETKASLHEMNSSENRVGVLEHGSGSDDRFSYEASD